MPLRATNCTKASFDRGPEQQRAPTSPTYHMLRVYAPLFELFVHYFVQITFKISIFKIHLTQLHMEQYVLCVCVTFKCVS
jgi:hypothetical protein